MFKMFAILGIPKFYLVGMLNTSSVNGVNYAINSALMTCINPGSFVWTCIVPLVSIKYVIHSGN